MRVLLYTRAFAPAVGGLERFAEALADWLTAQGYEVTVATRTAAPAGSDHRRGYRVLRDPGPGALRRAVRWSQVVHVNGLSLRGIAAARLGARRAVVTHQGHQAVCPTGLAWAPAGSCAAWPAAGPCSDCPGRGPAGAVAVAAHRRGAALAAGNVAVSDYLRRRLGLARSRAIYNPVAGWAFPADSGAPEDHHLVGFAGRLVEEKGLDLLLRALTRVPGAHLEVAGDGPMRGAWERLAGELGLGRRVRFSGAQDARGVAALYRRAAVVCVPTVCAEAFGYAAAEAMALGRAVVATPRGALPELLADGRGFVAVGAAPEPLAGALRAALEYPDARARAASSARRFAHDRLTLAAIGPAYVAAYEEAAGVVWQGPRTGRRHTLVPGGVRR